MAESAAIIGEGTTIGYSDTSNGTYTAIGEIGDISGPNEQVDDVEVTHQGSGNNKEYIPGLLDGGEVSFPVNYVKAQRTTLDSLVRVKKYFKITWPDSATLVWYGYIKQLGHETPIADKVTCPVSIKVSGKPTFTAGA